MIETLPLLLQFHMIYQRSASAQNARVLFGRNRPKVAGTDVSRGLTNRVGLAFESVPHHKRVVDRYIPTLGIFNEKRNVRRQVEEGL